MKKRTAHEWKNRGGEKADTELELNEVDTIQRKCHQAAQDVKPRTGRRELTCGRWRRGERARGQHAKEREEGVNHCVAPSKDSTNTVYDSGGGQPRLTT